MYVGSLVKCRGSSLLTLSCGLWGVGVVTRHKEMDGPVEGFPRKTTLCGVVVGGGGGAFVLGFCPIPLHKH